MFVCAVSLQCCVVSVSKDGLHGPFLLSNSVFVFIFPYFFVSVPCARLSFKLPILSAFECTLIYRIILHCIAMCVHWNSCVRWFQRNRQCWWLPWSRQTFRQTSRNEAQPQAEHNWSSDCSKQGLNELLEVAHCTTVFLELRSLAVVHLWSSWLLHHSNGIYLANAGCLPLRSEPPSMSDTGFYRPDNFNIIHPAVSEHWR